MMMVRSASEANKDGLLNEHEWEKATADSKYIYIPGHNPIRRKHKNFWTDANE